MEYKYDLSIVALVYNLEKYLPRCLDSLVNQTLENIEIICVDDGSTDSAPKIIDEYASKYPNKVKAYHKKNGGEFTTRNYGLEKASGEYITFVDTDDYVEPNWAEKLYNAAKENNADLAVCGFERIDLKTNKIVSKDMTGYGNTVKTITPMDDFCVFINPAPWNKIFKLDKVKDLRFQNFRNFNDMIFLASSYSKIEKIAFVPDVLYHYYLRYDSQIHNVNSNDVDNFKRYLLELKRLYIKENKYDDMKYIIDFMAFLHLGMSVMYRVSYDKSINMKIMLKDTIKYLDKNFSTWRKSPFLKFGYSLKRGLKRVALSVVAFLYRHHMAKFYIFIYRFAIDKLKIDIKW